MKIGSEAHKELFCQSFMASHLEYNPEELPWPQLGDAALNLLRGIPFWEEALDTERQAGAKISAYAATISDPLLREALALQGMEEYRHGRMIANLIERYGIEINERPAAALPNNLEQAFTRFGYEECLDSFFSFGMFKLARHSGLFPEQIFTLFDPIIHEEARHIVFFVNWVTYLRMNRGQGAIQRTASDLWHYGNALAHLVDTFRSPNPNNEGFTAIGASEFTADLTPEKFLSTCLEENLRRMSVFEDQLLRPQLIPRLSKVALSVLKVLPRRQFRQGVTQGRGTEEMGRV
ncbi:MAG: ferritin-like domain-containing protein [Chroococcidiopsidaceae cyanobacterium CP_BM_ER_R8_30]|nr:ferritin-like domain-containing protein [Chroococcidiopsidaceae cyanobacterium CP_BM_ER_R8_30]